MKTPTEIKGKKISETQKEIVSVLATNGSHNEGEHLLTYKIIGQHLKGFKFTDIAIKRGVRDLRRRGFVELRPAYNLENEMSVLGSGFKLTADGDNLYKELNPNQQEI